MFRIDLHGNYEWAKASQDFRRRVVEYQAKLDAHKAEEQKKSESK